MYTNIFFPLSLSFLDIDWLGASKRERALPWLSTLPSSDTPIRNQGNVIWTESSSSRRVYTLVFFPSFLSFFLSFPLLLLSSGGRTVPWDVDVSPDGEI